MRITLSEDEPANGRRQNQDPIVRSWDSATEFCEALEDGFTAERINKRAVLAVSRGWFRRAPA
jgi:hypothetical protein